MNALALDPAYRRASVAEFLEMDFGDAKAELENGLIFMMTGGDFAHARIAANLIFALRFRLRGTGCLPVGSDFALRTGEATIRYPDVAVHCSAPGASENDRKKLLGDPVAVFEVLSPSTASYDARIKLPEYRELAGVRDIVLVDAAAERIRLVTRTGPEDWTDRALPPGADLPLASLGISIPHAEVFARD